MSKHPIAWHEECLANSRRYAYELFEEAQKKHCEYSRVLRQNEKYAQQITEAKRQGLTAFDAERMGVGK